MARRTISEKYVLFIDESGIHKSIDHSTFVFVYVKGSQFEMINDGILRIERNLKIESFHWKDIPWKVKKIFIQEVLLLDFKVKIVIFKNPINPMWAFERSLRDTVIEKSIWRVFIDGKKPKWYEKRIKKVLRDKQIKAHKLKTVRSNQYPGIRLADMIAGLSRSFFDKKNINRIKPFYLGIEKKTITIFQNKTSV